MKMRAADALYTPVQYRNSYMYPGGRRPGGTCECARAHVSRVRPFVIPGDPVFFTETHTMKRSRWDRSEGERQRDD